MRPGDDLAGLIAAAAPPDLDEGDVLVVAHKVVSKAEGRVRAAGGRRAGRAGSELAAEHGKDPRLVQVVLDESAEILRAEGGVMICVTHHGFVCANAGVDAVERRGPDELVLLPRGPGRAPRGAAGRPGRRAACARRS